MSSQTSRPLLCIPIIHSQTDLGSLSESVRKTYQRTFGPGKWTQRIQKIEDFWDQLAQEIDALRLDPTQVTIYQDGLPCCGHEAEIVRDLASAGSKNHQILLGLMVKGAKLMGTESPELLLEEYQLAREMLATPAIRKATPAARSQKERSQQLLEQRDRFIAQRIDQTLEAGRTGLIFLGMLHSLERYFPPDVCLTRPGLESKQPPPQ